MGAWLTAAVLALMFVNVPGQFVGPLGDLADGADISLPVGLATASILYLTMLWIFPEPREVYGPQGPRLVRASDASVPPITTEAGAPVPAVAEGA
ncbi:Nitrate reductase OS=Streptomyces antimycoticus OX=68175 GN=SSPO_091470 PE=3 SV=1 [Streptomyces antimycoticus]